MYFAPQFCFLATILPEANSGAPQGVVVGSWIFEVIIPYQYRHNRKLKIRKQRIFDIKINGPYYHIGNN